jgi:hypothetical protein
MEGELAIMIEKMFRRREGRKYVSTSSTGTYGGRGGV